MPPKMLAVFAKHSVEMLPKGGVKPVNENQNNLVTCPIIPSTKCKFYDVHVSDVPQVLTGRSWPFSQSDK